MLAVRQGQALSSGVFDSKLSVDTSVVCARRRSPSHSAAAITGADRAAARDRTPDPRGDPRCLGGSGAEKTEQRQPQAAQPQDDPQPQPGQPASPVRISDQREQRDAQQRPQRLHVQARRVQPVDSRAIPRPASRASPPAWRPRNRNRSPASRQPIHAPAMPSGHASASASVQARRGTRRSRAAIQRRRAPLPTGRRATPYPPSAS